MDNHHSAQVIPFPARSRPAPAEDSALRLRRALTALEAAVANQREAVATWRGAMGSLDGTVRGLQESLHAYHARLGGLRAQVDAVGETARGLEAWADETLARQVK
ncbi:MAG: hypothetical protein IT555_11165 [Acetobacteraceae bacterium]|nr:hypothetical protein [Acetobacteraceae bacterium]